MKPDSDAFDCLVLGGGASGLLAAMTAAENGARVLLVDRAERCGNKLRIAGGGRANVTNRLLGPQWYVGRDPHFCAPLLRRFDTAWAVRLLSSLGIPLEEREDGQLFCLTPAAKLVWALEDRAAAAGVRFCPGCSIRHVTRVEPEPEASDQRFGLELEHRGERRFWLGETLLVALGSPAWPQVGASDFGLRLAAQFGHAVHPFRPVLAPFILPPAWPLHGLAGISLPVSITCEHGRTFLQSLLFTHKGLSGPAALQASCFWEPGQALTINFLPGVSLLELMHDPGHGKLRVDGLLSRYLPNRLAAALVPEDMATRKVAETGKRDRLRLVQAVHEHACFPDGLEGLAKAEAAVGGVDTESVDPETMESRLVRGLYFCGEVLDVTGLLGGYNLHWAWASGAAAGEAAARLAG